MHLAGLQKTSLIDFPGKVSCVAFTTGCNFTCPYCHNPDLARGGYPQRIALKDFLEYLTPRKEFLEGVVISGGEPTLSPGLADLCRSVRQLGLAVKLDTNGSRPDVLSDLLAHHLIDYVAMDIKTLPDRYAPSLSTESAASGVVESVRMIMHSDVDYEFRTTCVRPFVDETLLPQIACLIQGARRYALQTFRPEVVCRPDFFSTNGHAFSAHEMETLRRLAAPWVVECMVRGKQD